jgi:hypothetical protein
MEALKENLKRGYMSAAIMKLLELHDSVTPLEVKQAMKTARPELDWKQAEVNDYMTELHLSGDITYEDDGSYKPYSGVATKKPSTKKHVNTGQPLKKIKTKPISKSKAHDLMLNNKGHFYTAEFITKAGNLRVMNCQTLKVQTSKLGYVQVKEASKMRTDPTKAIRNINLQTLQYLKIGGVAYKVK